jgi:hypothetical protein
MFLGALFRVAAVAALILAGTAVPAHAALNECVPADLRDKATTFRTEDDVELSGLVFGGGSRGVALGANLQQSYCEWLPLARELADDGNHVLLFDVRLLDLEDPRLPKIGQKYDRDFQAAARELTRRGASSVVLAGEASSAAGAVLAAPDVEGLAGLVLVTPVSGLAEMLDRSSYRAVEPALRSLSVPVFIAAPQENLMPEGQPGFTDHARALAETYPAAKLDVVPGDAVGVALLTTDAGLRGRVVGFVGDAQPAAWCERLLWPAAGAVVLVLVGLVFVVRRRRGGDEPGASGQAFTVGPDPAPWSGR